MIGEIVRKYGLGIRILGFLAILSLPVFFFMQTVDTRDYCTGEGNEKCKRCPPFAHCEEKSVHCETGFILSHDICVRSDSLILPTADAIRHVQAILDKQRGKYVCKESNKDWISYGSLQGELYNVIGDNPQLETIMHRTMEWVNHSGSIKTRFYDKTVLYSSIEPAKSSLCKAKFAVNRSFIFVLVIAPIVFYGIRFCESSRIKEYRRRKALIHVHSLINFLKHANKEIDEDTLFMQYLVNLNGESEDECPWSCVRDVLNGVVTVTGRKIGGKVYYSMRDSLSVM